MRDEKVKISTSTCLHVWWKTFCPYPFVKTLSTAGWRQKSACNGLMFSRSVKSDFTLRCITPPTNVLQQIGGNLPSCGSRGGKSPPWLLEAIKGTTCPNNNPFISTFKEHFTSWCAGKDPVAASAFWELLSAHTTGPHQSLRITTSRSMQLRATKSSSRNAHNSRNNKKCSWSC